jgi:flagellar motor switch/type III secretory pathway protein FliN
MFLAKSCLALDDRKLALSEQTPSQVAKIPAFRTQKSQNERLNGLTCQISDGTLGEKKPEVTPQGRDYCLALGMLAIVSRQAMDPLQKSTARIIDSFSDISVAVEAQFEERLMNIREILAIRPGVVIPLGRAAGETLSVYVGNVFLGFAEVLVIDDHLALRITEFEKVIA